MSTAKEKKEREFLVAGAYGDQNGIILNNFIG